MWPWGSGEVRSLGVEYWPVRIMSECLMGVEANIGVLTAWIICSFDSSKRVEIVLAVGPSLDL